MAFPDTQPALLARLGNPADTAAWNEFCEIYEPTTYNLARRLGLQDADAREVTQEVLLTVSRQIVHFDFQRQGRFRGWLNRIARNTTIDILRRRNRQGVGGTDFYNLLGDISSGNPQDGDSWFDIEARREQFRWAANQVQRQVPARQWQAFWLTAVDGNSGQSVANQLEMSVGNVYVARCRVLARIKHLLAPYREDPS